MTREQVAGALVLDRLRERIVAGVYLGYWQPGDRLPSIREIAEAESVDRKTAAAAYQRLKEEGLVRVRPRSGVYLQPPPMPAAHGPLERLHRQWLAHAYDGARALGLDTPAILKMITAVAELERMMIPVIECTWPQAESVAAELRARLGLNLIPAVLHDLRPDDPILADAPLVLTTPYHTAELALAMPGRPSLELGIAPELFQEIRKRAAKGALTLVAVDASHASKLGRALDHCGLNGIGTKLTVLPADERSQILAAARASATVLLWPGVPDWLDDPRLISQQKRVRPAQVISDSSLARVRTGILDAAIRRVRTADRAAAGAKAEAAVPAGRGR